CARAGLIYYYGAMDYW
nr:immunoglobulin heavy chain junction region [Mus musculus]